MDRTTIGLAACLLAGASGLAAQDHAGHAQHAGKEEREIKALAPERVQGLLDGEGLGYALPAELNGFPGPRHVLDLRQELSLDEDQVRRVTDIFQRMQTRAQELGHRLVEAERALDQAFRDGRVEGPELETLVSRAAALEGELRLAHLSAHLETRAVLTAEQVRRYERLRGYRP